MNRESAVDVDFEKSEEERWKRHSYAANENPTDDVFTPPQRPKSTFFDSTILELSNLQTGNETAADDSTGNADSSSPSSPESIAEIDPVPDIPNFTNRTSVDSQIGQFPAQPVSGSDSLNRRKSRSISNFQIESLNQNIKIGPKFSTIRRNGDTGVMLHMSHHGMTHGSSTPEKPLRKAKQTDFTDFSEKIEENFQEAEAVWDYSSWDHKEELSFKAGDVIMVRNYPYWTRLRIISRSLKNVMMSGGGDHVII